MALGRRILFPERTPLLQLKMKSILVGVVSMTVTLTKDLAVLCEGDADKNFLECCHSCPCDAEF